MPRIRADASRCFPRHARIRKPGEFTTCFDHGSAVNGRYFRWIVLPADHRSALERQPPPATTPHPAVSHRPAPHRLGLAVSKKVNKRAVGRNRIKRLVREWFRHYREKIPPCDLVVIAKPPAKTAEAKLLRDDLHMMAKRCRALKPAPERGTMAGCAVPEAPLPVTGASEPTGVLLPCQTPDP